YVIAATNEPPRMPNQTSSVEINPEFRNGTDATYGAAGAATSAQRLVRLRAAKPQAPIMSRKRNSPNARPAPDFQSSAYDICLPPERAACVYLVPRDIDVMLDILPVNCVAPAIRRHGAKQVSPLLIGHLLEAFRFWLLAPNQKYEHAAVPAVSNVARFVGVFFFLARLQYSCRGADEPVGPLQLKAFIG